MAKRQRQAVMLQLVKSHRIPNQERLRELLSVEGFDVTQATLSRDIRELRLVKVPGAGGVAHYRLPEEWENKPPLQTLLPIMYLGAEGTGNLLIVRTVPGSASAVAIAIDWEEWPEVVGTIAGDDTIFIAVRSAGDRDAVAERLTTLAGVEDGAE